MRRGFSLVDLILAIGIIATLFGGIFLVYFSIADAAVNFELRRAASSILAQRVELVRNLPYEQVGLLNGIPAGVLQQSEQVDWDGRVFIVNANVRNVDDPFDGTVTSVPSDTAPADYKFVEFEVTCPTCTRFTPVSITTTVAPRGLENTSQNGSLFITVFDAEGKPVAGADVHVVNASTSPAIDFTDITDTNGKLQLVDVPTSTQAYAINVTKDGYSNEQTYAPGGAGNPNPVKPHATVSSQAVTELSFTIDRLAPVAISSVGTRCEVMANEPFTLDGSKLIGTSPDVKKYTFTSTIGVSGVSTQQLEWDTYTLSYTGSKYLVGTTLYQPMAIAPSSTQPVAIVLAPASGAALRVVTLNSVTGQPIDAQVALSGPTSVTASSSYAAYTETDWSGGGYTSANNLVLGSSITLAPLGGPYSTSTEGVFESGTIDLGGSTARAAHLAWSATTPAGTEVRFQIAGSDTGSGWSFIGPDGTNGSHFTSPSDVPGQLSNKRYVRYRAYLRTTDASQTPTLQAVALEFTGPCVPPGQRLFTGLSNGSYSITATAPGYTQASSTASVSSGSQQRILMLDPS